MVEEIKHLRKKEKSNCHLRYRYFITGQPDHDDDRKFFLAKASTYEQHSLGWAAFALAAELCPEIHCTGYKL